jgi:hypothetical protein
VNNDLLDGHDGTLDTCVSDPDPESNCETWENDYIEEKNTGHKNLQNTSFFLRLCCFIVVQLLF